MTKKQKRDNQQKLSKHALKLYKQCGSKHRYNTKYDAERYGQLYNDKSGNSLNFRPYLCDGCGGWHLTTKKRLF